MTNRKYYADQLRSIATEAAAALINSEKRLEETRSKLNYLESTGADAVKVAQARLAFEEAKQEHNHVKCTVPDDAKAKIDSLRGQFTKELSKDYLANPRDVDANTMALIDSGILTGADLKRLAENAAKGGNFTMLRIIDAEAAKRYQELSEKRDAESKAEKAELVAIHPIKDSVSAKKHTDSFDEAVTVVGKIMNNPALLDQVREPFESILEKLAE